MSLWLKPIIYCEALAFCLNTYAKDIKQYHNSEDISIRETEEKIDTKQELFLLNTRFGDILVELDDYDKYTKKNGCYQPFFLCRKEVLIFLIFCFFIFFDGNEFNFEGQG